MFEQKLRDVRVLKAQGMNSQVVKDCSTIVEQALEKFYKDIWPYLNADKKQNLVNIERKYSRKQSPINTLGLGRWIKFYQEGKLVELISKNLAIDISTFDFGDLDRMNELRNKCTHEGYIPSQKESSKVYKSTVEFLLKTRLIQEEPTGIRSALVKEKARPESQVLGDKIRLALANDPEFKIEEPFEEDMGKSYYVEGKWEFVGVATKNDQIRVLLLESPDSAYHEDVDEEVHEKVADLVKKRIRVSLPELKGTRILLTIAIDEFSWGDLDLDIEL
jgi:hypothetical protein